jgi:hypothetical protein
VTETFLFLVVEDVLMTEPKTRSLSMFHPSFHQLKGKTFKMPIAGKRDKQNPGFGVPAK